MDILPTITGIVLLFFFAFLGHPAAREAREAVSTGEVAREEFSVTAERRWFRLIFPGALAMGICYLMETALAGIFFPTLFSTTGLFVILAPVVEELVRWGVVAALKPLSPGEAVWIGGWMGVAETILKMLLQPMPSGTGMFRALFVVPFHGLLGGILRGGWRLLPIAIGLHAAFNLGISWSGAVGMVTPPVTVALAFLLWMGTTESRRDPSNLKASFEPGKPSRN